MDWEEGRGALRAPGFESHFLDDERSGDEDWDGGVTSETARVLRILGWGFDFLRFFLALHHSKRSAGILRYRRDRNRHMEGKLGWYRTDGERRKERGIGFGSWGEELGVQEGLVLLSAAAYKRQVMM